MPSNLNLNFLEYRQNGRCILPSYTTVARNSISFPIGSLIYNQTTKNIEVWSGTSWKSAQI